MAPAKTPPHSNGQPTTTSTPKMPSSEMEEHLGTNCYDTMKWKLKYKGVTETRHMNWFHAALEYERCSELDMPRSCRMVGNELKCAVPMEGTIGSLVCLMTLYGMKFSVTLMDYGSNGIFFDFGLKQKTMTTLIELFNTKTIDELVTNLTSYKKEIDDLHKAYFEQIMGEKASIDAIWNYTHPAEFLNKFIARVNVLNPLQTDELIFKQYSPVDNMEQHPCRMPRSLPEADDPDGGFRRVHPDTPSTPCKVNEKHHRRVK